WYGARTSMRTKVGSSMSTTAKNPAVLSSDKDAYRSLGVFMIRSVLPVLPVVVPCAKISLFAVFLTKTKAPPMELPINLASLALALTISLVSVAKTLMLKVSKLTSNIDFFMRLIFVLWNGLSVLLSILNLSVFFGFYGKL